MVLILLIEFYESYQKFNTLFLNAHTHTHTHTHTHIYIERESERERKYVCI